VRRALLSILAVGLLADHAFASAVSFTFNKEAALMLTKISHSPSGGIFSQLLFVTDDPAEYGGAMPGVVGYVGVLDATKAQKFAWMRIGADDDPTTAAPDAGDVIGEALGTAHTHDLSAYDEYHLFVGNDDNSNWSVRLFVATGSAGPTFYESGWTLLPPGEHTTLSLDLTGVAGLDYTTGIGFDIGATMTGGVNPSDPDVFHISTVSVQAPAQVPAPGALALTLFGLAGLGALRSAVWRKKPSSD